MSAADTDNKMRRLAQWMAEQFGRAPFFAGVVPLRDVPAPISNADVAGQMFMLRTFLSSFETGQAQTFLDRQPAAVASNFDVHPDDVRAVVVFLRHFWRDGNLTARDRVCAWLDAWIAEAERGRGERV